MIRFTIRDLLWLTLAVAMLCGCFVKSVELMDKQLREYDQAWEQISLMRPPLTGRNSVPPEWYE